jgi:alpha-mannosidase
VEVTVEDNGYVLRNRHLTARFAADGALLSLVDAATAREALSGPGNRLMLYHDQPVFWDAWDIDPYAQETGRPAGPARLHAVHESDPLLGSLVFEWDLGRKSRLRMVAELAAESRSLAFDCRVDWQERETLLKVAFPVQVRADEATYEMQFGCTARPTHANTLADEARYECPGHRWVDLSEHGYGVALLSDSKYGYAVHGGEMSISLLRGPTYPDPDADLGAHRFRYAVLPHAGDWREAGVVAAGAAFNAPLRWIRGDATRLGVPLFSVEDPLVVLDTVKRAEDDDAVIVRLYEAGGGHRETTLHTALPCRQAWRSNVLEEDVEQLAYAEGGIALHLRPFQVLTLKLR